MESSDESRKKLLKWRFFDLSLNGHLRPLFIKKKITTIFKTDFIVKKIPEKFFDDLILFCHLTLSKQQEHIEDLFTTKRKFPTCHFLQNFHVENKELYDCLLQWKKTSVYYNKNAVSFGFVKEEDVMMFDQLDAFSKSILCFRLVEECKLKKKDFEPIYVNPNSFWKPFWTHITTSTTLPVLDKFSESLGHVDFKMSSFMSKDDIYFAAKSFESYLHFCQRLNDFTAPSCIVPKVDLEERGFLLISKEDAIPFLKPLLLELLTKWKFVVGKENDNVINLRSLENDSFIIAAIKEECEKKNILLSDIDVLCLTDAGLDENFTNFKDLFSEEFRNLKQLDLSYNYVGGIKFLETLIEWMTNVATNCVVDLRHTPRFKRVIELATQKNMLDRFCTEK